MSDTDNLSRRRFLQGAGASATTVALAGCSGGDGNNQTTEDPGGTTEDPGGTTEDPGGTTEDSDGGDESEFATPADKAQAAWDFITENTAPEYQEERNQRYVDMEQAAREAAVFHPYTHDKTRRYWYDVVDVPKTGVLGARYLQHNETTVDRSDNELNIQSSTFGVLDPIRSTDVYSGRVIHQIYDKLVNFRNGTLEIENVLVENVEANEDNSVFTFELKEGVEFHDGSEFTAEDVVYTIRRAALSPNSLITSFVFDMPAGLGLQYEEGEEGGVAPGSLGIEAVDDHTVEMRLQNPHPNPLEILSYSSFVMLPHGLVDDVPDVDGEYTQEQVNTGEESNGTGPFILESYAPEEDVQLSAYDNYHGSGPELDAIDYMIVEQTEPIVTNIVQQSFDIFGIPISAFNPDQQTVETTDDLGREVGTYEIEENDETANYLGIDALAVSYYAFNVANTPEAVRKAVGYVMNREEIVNNFLKGVPSEALSFTPQAIWPTGEDGHEEFVNNHPYSANQSDIEGARQVLEEAGFTPDDPYELTISTADDATAINIAENIQSKLSGIGVEASVEPTQFSTLIQQGYDGALEMYGIGWSWSFPTPAYGLYPLEPKNTDTSVMPEETNGYYLDWQTNLEDEA